MRPGSSSGLAWILRDSLGVTRCRSRSGRPAYEVTDCDPEASLRAGSWGRMMPMANRFDPTMLIAAAIILVGVVAGVILNNAAGDLARMVFLLIAWRCLGTGFGRR